MRRVDIERQTPDAIGDLILDVAKRLLADANARAPDRAVDRSNASALPQRDKGGCVAIVVAPDSPWLKWGMFRSIVAWVF